METIIAGCRSCGAKNRILLKKQHLNPRCGTCKEAVDLSNQALPVPLGRPRFPAVPQSGANTDACRFFCPHCGPCRALAPIIINLACSYVGRLIVATVDTSHHPGTSAHYQIRAVPTLLFFRNSVLVDQMIGAPAERELITKLEQLLQ